MTIGFFLLGLLSYAEHSFSTTPSFLLSTYLFVTLLFDIAKSRTLWLRQVGGTDEKIAILTSVVVVTKLLLLLLETVEKRHILRYDYRGYPPEATAGIFNKVFFWWLNPLFQRGYLKSLAIDDLYVLDKQMVSKRLHQILENVWKKEKQKGPNTLLLASLKAFKWELSAVILPRASLSEPVNNHTNNVGYGLIGAYILVYTGMGITLGQHQHLTYRAITMVRGAIVSMVYKKACTLNLKDADPAESVTLMSADIERIVQGWQTMHEIWANVIEISLAIFLLEKQLGIACVVPVGVSIVALAGCLVGMAFVVARQALWLQAIERRISATTSMLASMKGIKMLGLQSCLMACVHGFRIDELQISRKFRKILVWNMVFAWLTRIFAPIFALGAFVAISHNNGHDSALNTSKAYTALSLFSLLADPILSLVMALMAFAGSVGSFARIQVFLDKESHLDPRNKCLPIPLSPFKEESKIYSQIKELDGVVSGSDSHCSKGSASSLLHQMVMVQNCSFIWESNKEPSIKKATFTIPSGNLAMFIGPSGCGKSTLLKAVLGEVPCQSGTIQLATESIAFCDETPWHMNGSIQDCIVAMSPFDSMWYATVVNACALSTDFEQLPRGDQTHIGSKGISLSGGQSQRIAIARAVYARKELVVFDDVFSSLDAETENHIFQHLLVKRVPFADHLVVLDKDGHIIEQGSFSALDASGGYVASLGLNSPEPDINIHNPPNLSGSSIAQFHSVNESIEEETENYRGIWVKWWASSNEANPGKHTGYYVGIYAMLGVVGMLSLIAGAWLAFLDPVYPPQYGSPVTNSQANDNQNGTEVSTSAPMLFFSTTDSGSILNRFSQDLQLIDMELPIAAINTFATLVLCLCQMILMGIASKYAAISFPLVILVVYTVQKIYLRTSRQLRFLDLEAKAPLFSHFTDSLSGLVTLRAFGWQHRLQEKHYQLLDRSQRPFYLLYAVQRWLTLTLDLVVAGIAVLLIILVVTLRGKISAGYVGVALLNVIMFSQSIKLLVTSWTNLETHIGSIQRVKSFTETVSSEDLPGENDQVPPDWPAKGHIEFKSVSAEYKESEPVLKNITLSIQEGEKMGICGRTGRQASPLLHDPPRNLNLTHDKCSGKTSLIMSLFRMIELRTGTITIDGIDLTTLPRQEIRSRLNGVSQSPLLIKGSVRQNLDPTGQNSDLAILNALKAVHLHAKVHELGGLDIDVDDLHLSHGQKQLFCLARATLRPGNILVLDEATSNVDSKTDEIMQRIIREKFSSHTILTVTHKLDSILDYDKVIVLEAGRVLESGDPYELLMDATSHFTKLYNASHVNEDPILV
ncbi:hypothetical protein AOCH_002967 [Aspergillus ochraceoroseus]|uniref:ABC multidrug transporter n=1 Tax=Aspergillus ochraceoroseus TaxID=138278 RepID=A0A0F8X6T7_9EURO|nr:hypothetical protein AOCH_002967 [Aspergillus ochraceoroseus]